DRRLEHELQLFGILGPDAVASAFPARPVEQLVRFVDTELPVSLLRSKTLGRVDEIRCGGSPTFVNMLLYCGAVDQQAECLPDSRIAEQRVFGLGAGTLAINHGPRIAAVKLNVFYIGACH